MEETIYRSKMEKPNKIIAVILCVTILVSMLSCAFSAVAAGTYTLTYTLSSNSTYYSVTGITTSGTGIDVTIPSTYNSKPVSAIGENAFKNKTAISSVTIPTSVTTIGNFAFYGCTSLTSGTILGTATSLGSSIFSGCTSMTSAVIETGVTSIPNNTFYGCTALTSVTIPNTVTAIGNYVFQNCSSLSSVTIPNSVTSIGTCIFEDCISLTTVNLPNSITTVSYATFWGCTSLVNLTIPNSVTSISDYAFYKCSKLASISPNSITSIGAYAFYGCTSLGSITIPNSVTSIGSYAFYDCSKLNNITLPSGVTSIGSNAFQKCTSLTSITIPSNVASISSYTFSGCTKLANITLPSNLTSIGNQAFENCTSLTSITIPNGVTTIGNYAFQNCTSLTSVNILGGVTSLQNYTFSGCKSLVGITIPSSVTSIGNSVFSSCTSLTSITIPNSVTSIGNSVFSGCTSLSSVTLPNSITSISEQTFYNCSSLTSVIIPISVTSIEANAFYGCSKLTGITIPSTVTFLGTGAFRECILLANINIPSSITSINSYTFYNCTKLTSATIPSGVATIGTYAFYNCTSLASLIIPTSLTTITGNYAFTSCNALKNIYYAGTQTQWNSISITSTTQTILNKAAFTYNCSAPIIAGVTGNPTTWTNGNVILTVNGAADSDGLNATPYCFSSTQGVYNWQASNISSTYSSNQTVYIYVRDALGNIALASTQTINKIDKTAPTITGITSNQNSSSTVLTVNGAADGDSGLSSTAYSFSTTQGAYNWQTSNSATFSSSGTVYIYVRDNAGNISSYSTQISIDTTAPTITSVTGNPASWTNSDVILTVNGASDSNMGLDALPYSFSPAQGVYNWQASNSATFSSNQTVYIYVRDAAGNIALVSTQTIDKIDKTAPTITSVAGNPVSWTNSDAILTVNGASDSGTGLNATPYSFSTTQGVYNWQASNVSPAYASNQTIYIYVRDVLGNIALVSTQTINKIDKTVPTITNVTVNPDSWTNENITLTVNGAADSESGLNSTAYSFSTTENQYNWQTANTAIFNANQTIYIYVRDAVGNTALISTQTINNYDNTMPTITGVTGNPTSWTKDDVTLTVTGASDSVSGLSAMPYSFSTTQGVYNWQASNSAMFSANQTIYIYVRDVAGNIVLVSTQTIDKIDKNLPTIADVTGNPIAWTNEAVILTVNEANDNQSGLSDTPYSFSTTQGEYSWQSSNYATFNENQTVYVYVRDAVGNVALVSTQIINKYDNTTPTITDVTGNLASWTNQDVTLTVNGATDSGSGLNDTAYSFSTTQGEYSWQSSNAAAFSSNGIVYIYVRDAAGNIALVNTQTIDKIDKTLPAITDVTGNPTSWTNGEVTLTVNAADSESGLGDAAYSFSTVEGEYSWQASNTAGFSSNGTVYIYVRDATGNISLANIQTIDKIDTTAPTVADVTGNLPDYATSGTIMLTVSGAADGQSGLSDKPYSFSTVQNYYIWQASNVSSSYTSSKTVYVYVRDAAGNIALVSTQDIKIDNVAPTITGVTSSSSNWTTDSVNLTVNGATDNQSGLNALPYSFSTAPGAYNWQASNVSPTYNSNQLVYIYVRDALGNTTLATVIYANADNTAPTFTVSGNASSWTNDDVTLVINSASDGNGSGLSDMPYSFSTTAGEYNWQAADYATFSANGTVYVYTRDKAGNISCITVTIDKIEKTCPALTNISSSTDGSGNITLTVNASDTGSGISAYSFDNGATWQASNVCTIGQSVSGVNVKIKDYAGNISTYLASDSLLVDDSIINSPIIYDDNNLVTLFNPGKIYSNNGSTAVTYDLTLQYKIGDGEWTTYTAPFEFSRFQNATVYARAIDSSNNISAVTQKTFISTIGQYTETVTDFKTDSYRNLSAFSFSRSYNSIESKWFFSINSNVADSTYSYLDLNNVLQTTTTGTVKIVTMPDGGKYTFVKQNSMLYKNAETGWVLQVSSGGYILYTGDLTYGFDANGKLSYITDQYSDTVTFTRTSSSVTVSVGSGYSYVAHLDANGNITSITNGQGTKVYVTYAYGNGNLISVTNAANEIIGSYEYTNNMLTRSSDTAIGYRNGRVTSLTSDNGTGTTYTYDDTNSRIDTYSVLSATNSVLTSSITYNNRLNTVTEFNQDSMTTYTYYSDGKVETCNTYYKTYDINGNTIYKLSISKTYDENGNVVSSTENDTTITYNNSYDSDGNLTSVTSSAGTTQTFTYVDGKLVREKGTNGKYTYYVYDVYGNVIIQAVLKSAYTAAAPDSYTYSNDMFDITVNKYDSTYYNNVAAVYDVANNTSITYTRDTYGNIVSSSSTNSSGATTTISYTYDQFNKQLSSNDGTSETAYAYDDAGRVIRVTQDGATVRYIYDSQGRLIQQIDSDIYNASLDGLNNAAPSNTYSDATAGQTYVYTSNGNLASETDKTGKTTSYTYDAYGHVTSKSFDVYTVNYTANGDISSVSIGSQTLVTYTYDSDYRLTTTAYANGQTIHYIYEIDSNGNETKGVYYNNETTPRYFYTYYSNGQYTLIDNINNTRAIYAPLESLGSTTATGYSCYEISYDINDGVITYTHSHGTAQGVNEYEGVTQQNEQFGNKWYRAIFGDETFLEYVSSSQEEDLAKLEAALGSNVDKIEEYIFGNSPNSQICLCVFYTEDENGNITGIKVGMINFYNDIYDIAILQTTSYTYTNNKITSETHTLNGSTETISYTYDGNGNITSMTRNGVTTTYYYDANKQLVRVDDAGQNKTTVYTYDGRGNILSKSEYAYTTGADLTALTPTSTISYTYGNTAWADELTSYNGNAITYDNLGNRTSYNGWTYTWEGGRLLTGMTNVDGTTITYKYNVDGIRTSKTVNGVTTTFTTIDGRITSQMDGTNFLYFWYNSDDELFGFEINDTNYIYVKNIQGDIIAITDTNGTIVVRYTYDAWGNTTSITGSLAGTIGQLNPMRYRSYYLDAETGYYYLQSRYYEPSMGRFINSDDPEVIARGTSLGTNAFAYCNNNPVMNIDPTGQYVQLVIGAIAGGFISFLLYYLDCQISHKKVKLSTALWEIAIGAASGALATTGVRLIGQVMGSVAASFADLLAGGGRITETDVMISLISGLITGFVGGIGFGNAKYLNSQDEKLIKRLISTKGKETSKAIVYYLKSTKKLYNKLYKEIRKSVVISLSATIGKKAAQHIFGE